MRPRILPSPKELAERAGRESRQQRCATTCTSACSGSCTAQANTECQIKCQDTVYTDCETETAQVCQTTCKDKGGAIFCDGQFVNAANAESCSSELKLKIDVAVDAVVGAADDVDGAAATKKKAKGMCSVGAVGASTNQALSGLSVLGGAAAMLVLSRKRRKSTWEK